LKLDLDTMTTQLETKVFFKEQIVVLGNGGIVDLHIYAESLFSYNDIKVVQTCYFKIPKYFCCCVV